MKDDETIRKLAGSISFWLVVFMVAVCACVWLSFGAIWGVFTIAVFAVAHIFLNVFVALVYRRKNG